ncbi:MAG: hypothetical protein ISR50_20580 [Alphaproteobacteria bacterium]|nr:hypothetical protein [Alphaproteobacteria bacterium]
MYASHRLRGFHGISALVLVGTLALAGCETAGDNATSEATPATSKAAPTTSMATSKFDGKYRPVGKASPTSGSGCDGSTWEKFEIAGGKLVGGINHSQAGYLSFSGSVQEDGTLRNAEATGDYGSVDLKGGFSGDNNATGTWESSDGRCSRKRDSVKSFILTFMA